MKKLKNILLVSVLTAGILNCAEAQRGSDRGFASRDFRSSNISPQRYGGGENYRNPIAPTRSFRENDLNSVSRAATFRRDDGRANAINNSRIISTNQQRNVVALSNDRNGRNEAEFTQSTFRPNRTGTNGSASANVYNRYDNYYSNRYYSNRDYSYGGNYYNRGGYYPRFFGYGPCYRVIPRSFISINFGGYPYYYNDGLFYGLYGGYYQPLFPPPGLSISVLPFGYSRIFIGDDPFYYYNGVYYRQYDDNNYKVVDAPMGATVSALPKGAKSVVLNGEKLYELNGTYYKEDRNSNGETVYTVVGKNGEVNNSNNTMNNGVNNAQPAPLNNGDVIGQLPEGSKIVTINGEKLYVTPDETYLKEESDGNIIRYKVVGK